jgi:hypothetical protein
MRVLLGLLVAAALACAIGACAAIAGLSPYSSKNCPEEGCDASVPSSNIDVLDTTDAAAGEDTGPHPGEDGGAEAGCPAGFLSCGGTCADPSATTSCGACGTVCPQGWSCIGGQCTSGTGSADGGDAGILCPDGGCPVSTPTGYSCPTFGHCNGTTAECTDPGGCFCNNDTQCKSAKCVKVTPDNGVSCGSSCTGSGSRDGFDCELASPGIPSLATGGGTYACPANSGYKNTALTCDSTHTNCYCTADSQCPSGKCVPNASNNNNCAGCTGTGTPDYRGCQATTGPGYCPIYIGCPLYTICQYPTCYCTADVACPSGHCIPSSHNNNCTNLGPCTGTGTDDGHGCMPPPSSIPCMAIGGTMCITTLTPAPVINAAKTACLCVDDSNCSSLKCVNKDSQCTGTCTGNGTADSEDCLTAVTVANTWSCSAGNCNNVSSPTGQCTAGGVPCWCTSDSQCPAGMQCAAWSGCASGACTGDGGTSDAFHCVP